MGVLAIVMIAIAVVLLVLEAFSLNVPRVKLGWLGLAFWAGSLLIGRF